VPGDRCDRHCVASQPTKNRDNGPEIRAFTYSTSSPDSRFADLEVEIAESLRLVRDYSRFAETIGGDWFDHHCRPRAVLTNVALHCGLFGPKRYDLLAFELFCSRKEYLVLVERKATPNFFFRSARIVEQGVLSVDLVVDNRGTVYRDVMMRFIRIRRIQKQSAIE
jgi:hypothetical protein